MFRTSVPASIPLALLLVLLLPATAASQPRGEEPAMAEEVGDGSKGSRGASARPKVDRREAEAAEPPSEADRPLKYLLIGDSMAWAIGVEMKPRVDARGDKFVFKSKISASIRGWGSGKAIRKAIRRYRPDAVIIVLGTNESQIPYPEHLEKPILRIVEAVGPRSCYWIGPPMWKEDTGVVDLLRKNTTPCRFFDSSPLQLDRRPDKIHPNRNGSRQWVEAIMTWLEAHPPRPFEPDTNEPDDDDKGASGP